MIPRNERFVGVWEQSLFYCSDPDLAYAHLGTALGDREITIGTDVGTTYIIIWSGFYAKFSLLSRARIEIECPVLNREPVILTPELAAVEGCGGVVGW